MIVDELETRWVPWQRTEVSHAHNRPPAERPHLPVVGEHVWYRRHEWERDERGLPVPPELVTVVEVQDPADTSIVDVTPDGLRVRDPNLWHLIRDTRGAPLREPDGSLRYAPVADPWPWLRLRRPNGVVDETREARLRGSAGWLPLDYRTRPERCRLPEDTARVQRPPLPPLNLSGR